MIRLKDVTCSYKNGVEALKDFSLEIENGGFCFITGKSGSGKSTLAKLITGELRAQKGMVKVNNFDMNRVGRIKLAAARRTIGVVFQDFRLIPTWTVRENLEFAMVCLGKRAREFDRNIDEVLNVVGLNGMENRYPKELSGGEQQRVAIARAIINHPTTIIADEPTGNLDPALAREIMELFYHIHDTEHITTIVITHAEALVSESNRRVVEISEGQIIRDERPEVEDTDEEEDVE